ncbi:MAG: peptidoglycan recognition family protein [Chloroflexi bacterium]|nr:peptidoglycan recognition family protein [Chloroflexota bacterium]
MTGRESQRERGGPSRRQMLQGLALAGALCLGGAATALLRNRPRVVVMPNGDDLPEASPAIARPAIVSRDEWGALPVNHSALNENGFYQRVSNPYGWYVYRGELRDNYQTLIVHHSSFYEADARATLLEAQRLHREDRHWADIGYHYLIDIDGTIYEGRDLGARGVHTMGHNTGSAGLCLLGDYRFALPPKAQLEATGVLGRWLVAELAITHLAGHSQFNPSTLCPGAALLESLPDMAARLGLEYGTDGYVPTALAGDGCECCGCLDLL